MQWFFESTSCTNILWIDFIESYAEELKVNGELFIFLFS